MAVMEDLLRPNEIYRGARVCRIADRPWLLVADFAEIEGRLECVGMELRSFLRQEGAVIAGRRGLSRLLERA